MGGKNKNLKPMWDKLMKQVDVEEPTLLFDQVHFGCTKRECKQAELEDRCKKTVLLESLISAGILHIAWLGDPMQTLSLGPMIWKDCEYERGAELRIGKSENQAVVQSLSTLFG